VKKKVLWASRGTKTQIITKFDQIFISPCFFFFDFLQPITIGAVCAAHTFIFEPTGLLILSSNILYPYLMKFHYFVDNKCSEAERRAQKMVTFQVCKKCESDFGM